MNNKLILSAILITALVATSIHMTVFAVENGVAPLGLEIAGKADEALTDHQTDIENFITEQKVNIAETQEERLDIIEEKKNALKTAIEEAKTSRQELITKFEAGDITQEEFVAEMKNIATDVSNAAKSMGELGEVLGGIGQDLSEEMKTRAQNFSEEIEEAESEVVAEGIAIAEEMSGKNLPIPDNIPNPPDDVPPAELPDETPDDVPPAELPDETPDDVPP
ncbi:MAG: hypothetical protein ACOC6G_01685, partial [Thermoproteota archaeon]